MSCRIDGCDNPMKVKNVQLCNSHYLRMRRHGDPLGGGPMLPYGRSLEDRLWAKVDKLDGGCWLWRGGLDGTGYGQINVANKKRPVHIVVYELMVGSVPEGLELDHLCHNADLSCAGGGTCQHRRCCNPSHLEPVTRQVNALRGVKGRPNTRTHCFHGHELIGSNVYVEPGGRVRCRECQGNRMKRFLERKAADV